MQQTKQNKKKIVLCASLESEQRSIQQHIQGDFHCSKGFLFTLNWRQSNNSYVELILKKKKYGYPTSDDRSSAN